VSKEFNIGGVHHLALVCKDMARTVDFYCNVLGLPLIKTIELPDGLGQHFFFDMGNDNALAFFWFPDSPEATPGVAAPRGLPSPTRPQVLRGWNPIISGHGSMNHVAFDVPAEKLEEYRQKLIAKGIEVTEVVNHDESPRQVSRTITPTTFVRSIYFFDPDGIMLEFAGWTRAIGEGEVRHKPATAADKERYLAIQREV
jgi:catechol 2,3-dioxygenase-like lactoylglutathione lyase family enzyme